MTPETLRQAFHALGTGDVEPFTALLADDVAFEFPGRRFGGRFEGKRRVGVFLKRNQRLFRDGLAFDVSWVGGDPERMVAQWTNRGVTHDGQDYRNRGVTVFHLRDGLVTEIQDYLDTERLARTWPESSS